MFLESSLKKIRIKQQDKLNSKNLYLYKSITTYIQNSNLRRIEKEEILQQIMDMMLQAQNKNKATSANWIIYILLMLAVLTFKQSILKQIIDPKYFIQPIPLEILIPLAISIILIISVVEVYKRISDNT